MQTTDRNLIDQCLAGNCDAFAQIVQRYQTLVCSIAYSATRNLNTSEELAQETFLSAWKSLKSLEDADKLRPWLCGIVRNLANNQNRKAKRDVLTQAGVIEHTNMQDATVPVPGEAAIAQDEIDLIDRALNTMPEQYREPLVLFYREEQSVARVAELLELTTDTVKQRLSRGRNMLREEVAAVVERGLLKSAPGRAFTVGVISALPTMTGSAKAATITMGSVKGAGAVQAAGWMAFSGAVLGPIAGLLGGYFGYSMSLRSARSDRERALIKRSAIVALVLITVMTLGMCTLPMYATQLLAWHPMALPIALIALVLGYVIALIALIIWINRRIAQIRQEDGTVDGPCDDTAAKMPQMLQAYQYRRAYESKCKLLGLPLISIRFGGANGIGDPNAQAARGWIAIGDSAYGILFASGGIAVGGIAVGGMSVGLISFGGLAIGGLALGGMAVGALSIGGAAIGYHALGGMAVAWKAAFGGIAVAWDYTLGGLSVAKHANDELAQAFFAEHTFFEIGQMMLNPWVNVGMVLLFLIPSFAIVRMVPKVEQGEGD